MNARTLNVLHDSRNEDVLTVTDCIDFKLGSHHVLVDEYRIFNPLPQDNLHVFLYIILIEGDDHVLTAEDIGRPEQYGIADPIRSSKRFLRRKDGLPLGLVDAEPVAEFLKALAVFCHVD